jgi:hypothetical protein
MFEVGDTVICIDKRLRLKGDRFEIKNIWKIGGFSALFNKYIQPSNYLNFDTSTFNNYDEKYFISLEEYRKRKIKKIFKRNEKKRKKKIREKNLEKMKLVLVKIGINILNVKDVVTDQQNVIVKMVIIL